MGYSRKPTKGTKFNYQIITHKMDNHGKPQLITVPMKVLAAYNKAGKLIRKAFTWYKPSPVHIVHQIADKSNSIIKIK